jgi:hypothetical protein
VHRQDFRGHTCRGIIHAVEKRQGNVGGVEVDPVSGGCEYKDLEGVSKCQPYTRVIAL